jgi:hypothetical protein
VPQHAVRPKKADWIGLDFDFDFDFDFDWIWIGVPHTVGTRECALSAAEVY